MTARAHRQELGERGEMLAVAYLKNRGYRILTRHFRCRQGEIDIIARKGKTLYFIEVKTRESCFCGEPLEAVSVIKKRRLYQTALWYMGRFDEDDLDVRFSVIGIDAPSRGQPDIEMIEDAFEPDDL